MRESTVDPADGQPLEAASLNWFKSSRSGQDNNCVEVAVLTDQIAVRDSKDRSGPALVFPATAWTSFVTDAKSDRFHQ